MIDTIYPLIAVAAAAYAMLIRNIHSVMTRDSAELTANRSYQEIYSSLSTGEKWFLLSLIPIVWLAATLFGIFAGLKEK